MATFNAVHVAWLALAIGLEIVANIFLKYSDGFRRAIYGVLSLVAVLGATVVAGWVLFGQRLNRIGWLGVGLLIAGMVLIKFA